MIDTETRLPRIEKHIHAWTPIYELTDRITVQKCAFRTCSGIAVRQWQDAAHMITTWPNGDVEILPV